MAKLHVRHLDVKIDGDIFQKSETDIPRRVRISIHSNHLGALRAWYGAVAQA
jgi:hypothetical protein